MRLYVYKTCSALHKGGDGYHIFFGRNGVDYFIPSGFVTESENGYLIEACDDVCFLGIGMSGKVYLAMRFLFTEVDLDRYRLCKCISYENGTYTSMPAITDAAASMKRAAVA